MAFFILLVPTRLDPRFLILACFFILDPLIFDPSFLVLHSLTRSPSSSPSPSSMDEASRLLPSVIIILDRNNLATRELCTRLCASAFLPPFRALSLNICNDNVQRTALGRWSDRAELSYPDRALAAAFPKFRGCALFHSKDPQDPSPQPPAFRYPVSSSLPFSSQPTLLVPILDCLDN